MITTILQLLLSLSILVFIHELGHFLVARFFKTKVDSFYLFFNPWFSLFKWKSKRSGTEYGIGWLPLGGYCKIAGMIDESLDEKGVGSEPQPWEFRSKPAWQRLLIMVAGVVMNFLLAMVIYIGITFHWGSSELHSKDIGMGMAFTQLGHNIGLEDGDIIYSIDGDSTVNVLSSNFYAKVAQAKDIKVIRARKQIDIQLPKNFIDKVMAEKQPFMRVQFPMIIDSVLSSSPSYQKLEKNDHIIGVAGVFIKDWLNIKNALNQNKGKITDITILRGQDTIHQAIQISSDGHLGILLKNINDIYPIEHQKYNLITAIPRGISQGVGTMWAYIKSLKLIASKEGMKQLGGLGTMGKLFSGGFDWLHFWTRTAFLSIIFAVMNLLPIPALDGGHIMFLIIEMVRKKPLSVKAQMRFQMFGMILLLALMIYANLNDVYRFLIK